MPERSSSSTVTPSSSSSVAAYKRYLALALERPSTYV